MNDHHEPYRLELKELDNVTITVHRNERDVLLLSQKWGRNQPDTVFLTRMESNRLLHWLLNDAMCAPDQHMHRASQLMRVFSLYLQNPTAYNYGNLERAMLDYQQEVKEYHA